MSDVETRFLPLLPLSTGVVLPQMVVPLGLESDEAKAAADAALGGDGLLVLVPRIETDDGPTVYAKVGTVAKIEEAGRLPGGGRGVLVRGLHRAQVGAGVPGTGSALWLSSEQRQLRNWTAPSSGDRKPLNLGIGISGHFREQWSIKKRKLSFPSNRSELGAASLN